MITIELVYNLAILVAITVISNFIDDRFPRTTRAGQLAQGLLFGTAAVVGMLRPFVLRAGVFFDGRSMMISLAALFFGPPAAAVTVVMTAACRLWQGGGGMVMGLLVIVASAGIGLAFRRRLRGNTGAMGWSQLLVFGFCVHIVMVGLMATLPRGVALQAILLIGPVVLGAYPLATVLAGRVLGDQWARTQLVASLRRSEAQWRTLVANVPGVVYRASPVTGWGAEYMSEGVEPLTGRPPADFTTGRVAWIDLIPPDERERVNRILQEAIASGSIAETDYPIRHADGTIRWVHDRGQAIRDADNRLVAIDGVVIDITDRRREQAARLEMERRLLHAQKLESLGVLAGGIAHDFNNLLTAILGNLELGLAMVGKEEASSEYFRQAVQASRRAADLTRQMLAYSGRGQFVFSPLDLNELVRENAGLFRASVSRTVTLELQLAETLPRIEADAGQVQQVVMNLITNASEAIGENAGAVTLITSEQTLSADDLAASRVAEKAEPGRFVCLEVRDTGCGMDEETRQRLFDPFFTTKFTGRGLGLSALQGIMQGHHGAVLVDSELGRGTTVRALFPVVSPAAPATPLQAKRAGAAAAASGAGRTVLVVDDEAPVRDLAEKIVRRLGYDVVSADGGMSALLRLQEDPQRFGCVLLDLTMPGMDGVSALKQIRQVRRDVPVVLCSGFSEADATLRFGDGELAGFLHKPYGLPELRDALEGVLPVPSVPPEGVTPSDVA